MARITRAQTQNEQENQLRDELLLQQQLLQSIDETGAASQSEYSPSEASQDLHERDRDTAQKQVYLVNALAGVKRKREGTSSPGEQATRVRASRTNSVSPNYTRGIPIPDPSGHPKSHPLKSATLFTTIEAEASQSADQRSEATQDSIETGEGSYDRADDDEADDDEADDDEADDDEADDESISEGTGDGRAIVGGELRDEESVDESETPRSDNSDESVQLELFGQEAAWNNVLEGVRMVGVSRARNARRDRTQDFPALTTRVIMSLVRNGQRAGYHFKSLINARKAEDHEQINDLEKRLNRKLKKIKEQVEKLTEAGVGTKGSETITDIYAHAIPNLVVTLRWGFICQTDHYSRPNDLTTLESMIYYQDTLLLLCEKAYSWKAKDNSSVPIQKATTAKIFPYLRNLREAFANEHEDRIRVRQLQQIQLLLIESHEKLHEKRQRQKIESTREQERKCQIIAKDLHRRYTETFGPNRNAPLKNMAQARALQRPAEGGFTEWTSEQDVALLIELMKEPIRHLPAKQRYLVTLNTPLLQNKLPEHIRDRALYYKDALEMEWGDRDFVRSIE